MGLLERLRRQKQQEEERFLRESEERERKYQIDSLSRREKEELEERLKSQAKTTLTSSHFPKILQQLKDEGFMIYNWRSSSWNEDGDVRVLFHVKESGVYIKLPGEPYSTGYFFFNKTPTSSNKNYSGTSRVELFAIEARADGLITLHSEKPQTIDGNSSYETQDRVLDIAYSNPIIVGQSWTSQFDGRG